MKKTLITAQIAFTCFVSATLCVAAFAQSNDADFASLLKARKTVELESLANERLTKNPKDDVALWYLGRAVGGDAQKREQLIPKAEQCIKDLPQSARCHNALGSLYGAAAMSGGLSAGLKYASSIKERFAKAVELEPQNFDMRNDLNQFYLMAPGIAGGSVRKAIESSETFAKFDASRSKILRANVHIYEKEYEKADALLGTIKPGSDADLTDLLSQSYVSAGFGLISEEEFTKAQKIFERLATSNPNNAYAHLGLGRTLLAQKNVDAAIQSLERATALDGKVGAHYRLGIAYQTKGDKAKASAAFQQFLTYQTQGKAVDDAKKRLEDLKRG